MSVDALLAEIAAAEKAAGRAPGSVKLLPVSKTHPAERIRSVFRDHPALPARLGENYVDEFLEKRRELGDAFEWHFIGRIQSRRIPDLCAAADVLHTVSRMKELEAIARAPKGAPRFFLQVNVSGEGQKNGCEASELEGLLEGADRLGLSARCLGLMALPAPLEDIGEKELRRQFSLLRGLRDRCIPRGALSMGMSGDFGIAISEGSDWIRVGTAIFGSRAQ